MANETVTVTQSLDQVTVVSEGPVGLNAGGTISGALNVGVDGTGHDVKFFGDTAGKYMQWDQSADKLFINGELEVNGSATTFNSTVITIDDPIFSLGGQQRTDALDDSKDRGLEFFYHDGAQKTGFMGYDDSADAFTFLTSATNSNEVFSGTAATVQMGHLNFVEGSGGQIQFNGTEKINIGTNNIGLRKPIYGMVSTIDIGLSSNPFRAGYFSDTLNIAGSTIGVGSGPTSFLLESASNHYLILNTTSAGRDILLKNNSNTVARFTNVDVINLRTLKPNADDSFDIGSSSLQWKDGHFSGTVNAGEITLSTATPTLAIQSGTNEAEGSKIRLTEGATFNGAFIHYDGSANALNIGVHDPFNSTLSDDTNVITIPRDTGRVGIGVAAPSTLLSVGSGGDARAGNTDFVISDNTPQIELRDASKSGIISFDDNSGFRLFSNFNSNVSPQFVLQTDGKVGINELSPTAFLHVGGGVSDTYAKIGYYWTFASNTLSSSGALKLNAGSGENIHLQENGTDRLVVKHTTGNVGIGVTAPSDKLSVNLAANGDTVGFLHGGVSALEFERTSFDDVRITNTRAYTSLLALGTAGGVGINIKGQGNGNGSFVGIGTAAPSELLHLSSATSHKPVLLVENTNADSSGAFLRLFKNTASAGVDDNIGAIQFQSNNNQGSGRVFAQIAARIHDPVAATATGELKFNTFVNGTDTTVMTMLDGKVGLNNTNPTKTLDITGGIKWTSNSTADGNITFSDDVFAQFGDSNDLKIYHGSNHNRFVAQNGDIRFSTNNTERLRIEDSTGLLRVFGDLQVDGTTTTVNSTVVTIDDPVLTLGGDTAPSSDDNKDRGIEFRYYDSSAKIGFMGWDDSAGGFTLLKDATNSSEVFSGTAASLVTGAISTSGSLSITGDKSILNQGDAAKGSIRFYDQSGGIIMLNGGTTNDLRFDSSVKFLGDQAIKDGSGNSIFQFYTSSFDGVSAPITRFGATMVLEGANAPSFLSRDNIVLRIDSNNDSTSNFFKVEHNAGTELFKVEEDGKVTATGTIRSAAGTIDLSHATTGSQTATITAVDGNKLKLDSSFTLTGEAGVSINLDAPTVNISGSASGGNGLAIVASATPVANNTTLHIGDGFTDSIGFTGRARNTTQFFVNRNIGSADEDLINFKENGASRFLIDESGNIGMGGITAPATKVHIFNGTGNDPHIRLSDPNSSSTNDATGYLEVYHGNTTGRAGYFGMITNAEMAMATTCSSGNLSLYTGNGVRALSIDNSQRVGIGTNSPLGKLHVHTADAGSFTYDTNADDLIVESNNNGGITIATASGNVGRLIFASPDDPTGAEIRFSKTGNLMKVGPTTPNADLVLQAANSTEFMRLDAAATNIKAYKNIRFSDNVISEFGTSGDFRIFHDGSNSYLEQKNAGTGNIVISNANDAADIIFQSDNGSGGLDPYITIDGGNTRTNIHKDLQFTDNVKSKFGTSGDLEIFHDGTNSYIENKSAGGDLYIKNTTDNKDIIFQSDDGSGGTATYLTIDGGREEVVASKPLIQNPGTVDPANNGELAFTVVSNTAIKIKYKGTDGVVRSTSLTLS